MTDTDFKEQFLNTYEGEYPKELTDGYELLECIGGGGQGETLLASERGSGRRVAVKCYMKGHPFFADSEPLQIKELSFPGIPAYITEFKDGAMRCVVREYIEGDNLEDMRGKLSERQVCKVGIQLCEILDYLHSRKPPVIHRDIKPQNVIMQPDGRIALIDFGISRCYSYGNTSDTVYGGTQGFAPPEQYGFAQTDCRSDIYSLGILLTWLYCGSLEPVKKPVCDFEKILARCTDFTPKGRFRSAVSLKKKLEGYLYSERRRKKFFLLAVSSTAVLAAASAVLGVLLWRSLRENGERSVDKIVSDGGTSGQTATKAERRTEETAAVNANGELTGSISGSCGDKAAYVLDFDTDTLTISGEGATYCYYRDDLINFYNDDNYRNERAPWYKYTGEFSKLVVEEGITELAHSTFFNCHGLKEVELKGTKLIRTNCFGNCGLTKIVLHEGVENIESWAFADNIELESVELPESLVDCGNAAFARCTLLKKIVFHGPTAIHTIPGNEQSVLADDSGEGAPTDTVFYCLSYGGAIIHAEEFGIPYVIIE